MNVTLHLKTVFSVLSIFRMAFQKAFGTPTTPYNQLPKMTIKVIALSKTINVANFVDGDAKLFTTLVYL